MGVNEGILEGVVAGRPERDAAAPARPAWRGPWLQLGVVGRYEWNRVEVPLARLPRALDGLRIVQLADLHLRKAWHPGLDEVLARLANDPPDLLVLTGDIVDDKYDPRPALPLVDRFATALRSRHGIFAISGNHDGDLVLPRVARHGVTVLTMGRTTVHLRGERIELVGLAGITRNELELQDLLDLPPRGPGVTRIVLSHYPDALRPFHALGNDADLFFAGHTHGGQVCLPGRFPILRHDTLPRRFCSGVHRVDDTWLVVSRGMGFSTHAIRVFCPAEVMEVVLKAER